MKVWKKKAILAAVALALPGAAFAQVDAWTGSCTYDDTFATQGGIFAQLGLVPFPTWDAFDVDQDGVSDAWQAQLLAYSLCSGNAAAQAGFDTNKAEVQTLVSEFTSLVAYLSANHAAITALGNTLNGLSGGEAACNSPATLAGFPPLDSYFALLQGSLPGITTIGDAFVVVGTLMSDTASEYAPFPPVLGLIADVLAELGGHLGFDRS